MEKELKKTNEEPLTVHPGKDSRWLPVLVGVRAIFVPLFMLCNVQPRSYLPVLFEHDAWYIIFMIFFSFSNGYLASLCMCFGPKKVAQHEAETAGATDGRRQRAREAGATGPYHLGQSEVGQDRQEDDHTGRDEVAEGAVLQGGASCRDKDRQGKGGGAYLLAKAQIMEKAAKVPASPWPLMMGVV
ncbi:hypothetical protein CRUP_010442 [Coryphaenoides rupestris]|nr:hypothetical protein CRUP_010442 [Coryphaenoides rupestris]